MRILVIQDSNWLFEKGPYAQHHVFEKLSLSGHEIRVIDSEVLWRARGKKGIWPRREVFPRVRRIYDGAAVTVVRPGIVRIRGLDMLSLIISHAREINRQLKEFDPDAIVTLGVLSGNLAIRFARRSRRAPIVDYWYDVWHELLTFKLAWPIGKVLRPLAKAIEQDTLRKADAVLTDNQGLHNLVVKMGARKEWTFNVKEGFDSATFRPEIDGRETREQYGIKQDDIVLFFLGMSAPFSGLVEAARGVLKCNEKRLKLMFVGSGDLDRELERIHKEEDRHDQVILVGRKPFSEVPKFIAASDICLLPYHDIETTRYLVPMKTIEYMAMGKPLIATRLPGLVEEFGEDSGVVYVDHSEEVAAKALELVQANQLSILGARARMSVQKYSWDSIAGAIGDILEKTIEHKHSEIRSQRM